MEAKPELESALATVQDPDILLNFARQLSVAAPGLEDWGKELFETGIGLAMRRFKEAGHPTVAIEVLFRLTRRQVNDFDRAADAIRFWEEMGEEKRNWLWSQNARYWEYLGLLVRAYCMERKFEKAESFARQWLEDPATPPSGLVHIGIPYGQRLVRSQRMAEAFLLFDRLVVTCPTHALCALAWYWKALAAHQKHDAAERDRCASCLQLATGRQPGVMREKELFAKAALLLADLDPEKVPAGSTGYSPDVLQNIRLHILQDLAHLT